jgi:hypothetical protein
MSIDPWTPAPSPLPTALPARARHARFSLAALVLLVTTCGVVFGVAAASLAPRTEWHPEQVVANALIGLLVGGFLGGFLATTYELRAGWIAAGAFTGHVAGAVAGALSGCDIHLPTALVGAAVLVVVGGVCWVFSARKPLPAPPTERGPDLIQS